MYAQQPSARWKIAGKKPKDKYPTTSEKMLGDDTLKSWGQIDEFRSLTTAEGLYKQEHDLGDASKVDDSNIVHLTRTRQ